jgi:xanthine dehydrogenase molybdenum-binding subunit
MSFKCVNQRVIRKDIVAKVTGRARYTADRTEREMLYGALVRSKVAHGYVKSIDISKAEQLPGVIKVVSYHDLKAIRFPTCGHPHSLIEEKRDIADKMVFTNHVRHFGDEIAGVVAVDSYTARKAAELVEVEYEKLPVYLGSDQVLQEGAKEIHKGSKNIVKEDEYEIGSDVEPIFDSADHVLEEDYDISPVKHCHLENQIAYAYQDDERRIVVVTATQIPHIVRRVLSQAFELPYSTFRIIKPYVGGGFGNKQDVVVEPQVVALSLAVGGKPVLIEYTREEQMVATRTRHAVKICLKSGFNKEGEILAQKAVIISNGGGYAAHGHAITETMAGNFMQTYMSIKNFKSEQVTAYTNIPVAGAMRAYGVPQISFAVESHLDSIAGRLQMDPAVLRDINMTEENLNNEFTGVDYSIKGLKEAIIRGKERISWNEKQEAYQGQSGEKRRGVGMACFTFDSGCWPYYPELAGARITMNQDGHLYIHLGAVEIGQGSDTVFCQMAAEVTGVSYDNVHINSLTDTDYSPFDTGAYGTRQTYITGQAVVKAAKIIYEKILEKAAILLDINLDKLDVTDDYVIDKINKQHLMSLADLAINTYYNEESGEVITCSVSNPVKSNAINTGVCFTEVEVDITTGKVNILDIFNIHDCGTVINPDTAEGQVHGGISMGIGFALMETMLFNKEGIPLNDNLLDYKLPTTLDHPDLGADFVETYSETGPFGAKGLSEPTTVPTAPAIRNAILQATGVKVNNLPMNPQCLFEHFKDAGLV